MALTVREIDVVRHGESDNLLSAALQDEVYKEVLADKYHIIVESPPCDTFSRAPFSGHPGPKPLRSAQWPRGLPGVPPLAVQRVRDANILTDFAIKILQAAGEVGAMSLLEYPEDLGPSKLGTPASLWQRSDMKALTNWGFQRGAIYQSV